MIHFFPTFSKDAKNSPFARELVSLAVPHRIFPGEVILRYRSRVGLLFFGWPKVAWFGLKSSIRSLLLSAPYPDTVVVGSHIEALIFSAFRALRWRNGPSIVLLGFIMTARKSALISRFREIYFGFLFSIVDQVICHSTLEVERYSACFRNSRARFLYIPCGLHIDGRDGRRETTVAASRSRPYILTAGRSGRDYATLFEAVEPLAIDLHVICDDEKSLAGLNVPKNVFVQTNCYDNDYTDELIDSLFVVIPLGVSDISAGQMVLIQAMAFAKPTIITRTATVEEYVADGVQSLLVAQGSTVELRAAIRKLLVDSSLAARLATNAKIAFEEKFCMKAYVKNLIARITMNDTPSIAGVSSAR